MLLPDHSEWEKHEWHHSGHSDTPNFQLFQTLQSLSMAAARGSVSSLGVVVVLSVKGVCDSWLSHNGEARPSHNGNLVTTRIAVCWVCWEAIWQILYRDSRNIPSRMGSEAMEPHLSQLFEKEVFGPAETELWHTLTLLEWKHHLKPLD